MIQAGWKKFKCNDCGAKWSENTRDYQSCSIGDCIDTDCGSEDVDIVGRWSDDTLALCSGGNLLRSESKYE